MILNMQPREGTPQNLPPAENFMETGSMGDCVAVIVLWNLNLAGTRYADVRGWHGDGGIRAINFPLLFHSVPDIPTTQIIVAGDMNNTTQRTLEAVQEHVHAERPNANIRVVKDIPNARVDRSGVVTRVRD